MKKVQMKKTSADIGGDLEQIVRGDVFVDMLHRAAYSSDASIYRIIPTCVLVPRDIDDIVATVKYAAENNIPVVARGAGSGVAGESLSSGIILDIRRYMNRIISAERDGGFIVTEPGVVLDDLNSFLSKYKRKIGPDPSTSNRAVIGGCVANNSTGAHSLQYGYMSDYVESLEAVLSDGSVVEFQNDFQPSAKQDTAGSIAGKCLAVLSDNDEVIKKALPHSKRNRSGYNIAGICHNGRIDMAKLLAGSEGTLAIFTKIRLRTVKLPQAEALLQLEFDSLEKMARAAAVIVDSGASACELMDKTLLDMARDALPQYRDILPSAEAVLLVEHTGDAEQQVIKKIETTSSVVGKLAVNRKIIFDTEQQSRLWKSRNDAVPLLCRKKTRKHPVPFIEDVSVDSSKLAEYISGIEKIGKRYGISLSYYGHAGDGELHIRPYLDLSRKANVRKMVALANEVFSLAWSLGGSISGEHADGLVRAAFIRSQFGDKFYNVLCRIKNIFDPAGIMNPGKIINSDPDIMIKNLKAEDEFLPERLQTDLLFEGDELLTELEQCNGCGLCLSKETDLRLCPVFRALEEELGSTRAKANLLNLWMKGKISEKDFESDEFKKFLDLCINCKLCSVECPSGIDVSKLIVAARAQYVKRKGLKRAEFTLSRNRYLSVLGSKFSWFSNFIMRVRLFKKLLEIATGLDRRRQMPAFNRSSFLKKANKYLAELGPIEKPVGKVAYFVDTFANYNDHELGFAVIDFLRHNNIDVTLPTQRPVPLPALCYGDVKTAKKDLAFNAERLAQVAKAGYIIVCSEPSAALCLQKELRHFVAGEDAKLVSENTVELMSYLLGLYKEGKLKTAAKKLTGEFAYHTPCHLFALGTTGASIELLDKLCGLKVNDLKGGCCGLAGTFGMQKDKYELSEKISENLRDTLKQTLAKIILTECAACGMQIEHISGKKAIHPIKLLAECYGKKGRKS